MIRARRSLAIAALAAALVLSACQPAARLARDLIDTSDGASLTFVERGLRFDPDATTDGRVALGVVLVATGTDIVLIEAPVGTSCDVQRGGTLLDCRLGDADAPLTVYLTGRDLIASASYRRADGSMPRVAYAR